MYIFLGSTAREKIYVTLIVSSSVSPFTGKENMEINNAASLDKNQGRTKGRRTESAIVTDERRAGGKSWQPGCGGGTGPRAEDPPQPPHHKTCTSATAAASPLHKTKGRAGKGWGRGEVQPSVCPSIFLDFTYSTLLNDRLLLCSSDCRLKLPLAE